MEKEKMKIGEQSKPRFEYRTFGQCFCKAAWRMSRLSVPVPEKVWERRSEEIYIISTINNSCNTKIRDGRMDIKRLVQCVDSLEQWEPLMKADFPINTETLKRDVFPAFMVKTPTLDKSEYTLDDFLSLLRGNHELLAVEVIKQRFGYMVNDTICEVANVLINGAKVVTVSIESTEKEDVRKTISDLGLADVENINYLEAIKRVVGFSGGHLANRCLCGCGCGCDCEDDCNSDRQDCKC